MQAHILEPIFFDCEALLEKQLTGIGRFTARLIEALARVRPVRLFRQKSQDDLVIGRDDVADADHDLAAWARGLPQRVREPHDHELAARCAAVYPALRPAVRHFRREISVLHDFAALLLPATASQTICFHYGRFFGDSSALSDKLVAISESTKHDARWLCAKPNADVIVGRPGPSMCVRSHAHPGAVPRRDDIILVVSTLEPRKNGPFLLDWFCKTEVLPSGMQLWWVGPQGWWTSRKYLTDLSRQARRVTKGRVKLLGMVPDARLCALYRQAAFTIYPSLYEGFGFPVLDALLHGAPVLCGFNSSLEEFATNGIFYFDVGNAATLDAACRACLAARPVAIDREWLASRFSWDGLARQVLDLAA